MDIPNRSESASLSTSLEMSQSDGSPITPKVVCSNSLRADSTFPRASRRDRIYEGFPCRISPLILLCRR